MSAKKRISKVWQATWIIIAVVVFIVIIGALFKVLPSTPPYPTVTLQDLKCSKSVQVLEIVDYKFDVTVAKQPSKVGLQLEFDLGLSVPGDPDQEDVATERVIRPVPTGKTTTYRLGARAPFTGNFTVWVEAFHKGESLGRVVCNTLLKVK
jgi:hypothetical protein